MTVAQQTPAEAHETLASDTQAAYLDVRTEAEFESGHPPGAYNVPVVFLEPGTPARPNPDFLTIVIRHMGRDRKLIVGCNSGGRSRRACDILEKAGFGDLTNMRGGFGGERDRSGKVVTPGWKDCGLDIETGQPQERSYASLSASE